MNGSSVAAKSNVRALADEPRPFRVWSEHLAETDARVVLALTTRGAMLMAIAWEDDDGALASRDSEDWLVRDPGGRAHRFRLCWQNPDALLLLSVRACRDCGALWPRDSRGKAVLCAACRPAGEHHA